MRNSFLFTFLVFVSFSVLGQNAMIAISKINAKYASVKDYKVQVEVKASIPTIKILPSKATIYFKQKNKFKIVSKGIVLLPKQGFSELYEFLAQPSKYMAVYGGFELINGVKAHEVNVIPDEATNEMVLAKLWMDEENNVVMKSQITTKSNGTILTYYEYADQLKFGLPSKMTFEIDVKKFKIPKSVAADINNSKKEKTKEKKKGTIVINLSDYTVNKGIDDALFVK